VLVIHWVVFGTVEHRTQFADGDALQGPLTDQFISIDRKGFKNMGNNRHEPTLMARFANRFVKFSY
jgi:hypothetical protein